MKLYRFSPIETQEKLMEALEYVHIACHQLCQQKYGEILPVAGNMTIFCHYPDEFETIIEIRKNITDESEHFNHKYFRLLQPFVVPAMDKVPQATYTHLYIRHPDPYRSQVGDLDFYLEPEEYSQLKQSLEGQKRPNMRQFERADPDMVELHDPDSDVLAYISDVKIADLVEPQQE